MVATRTWLQRGVAAACAALLCLGMSAGTTPSWAAGQDAPKDGQTQQQNAETRMFTDSAGRTVEIPVSIERIAPSGGISQQVLMTIAPDKMVGVASELTEDQLKYFGEEYADLPAFGTIFSGKGDFNKEAVAAADPQIVIDIGQPKDGLAEDLDTLQEQIGIPCVFIETTLDTFDEAYLLLGELLGVEERAAVLAEYCASTYDSVVETVKDIPEGERVTVAYLQGDNGLNAMPKGSYHGVIVDMCADNVVELPDVVASGQGSEVSFEQLAVWDPEMIIFGKDSLYETAADDPAWATLAAIDTGNYYEIPFRPFDWMNRPPSVNQLLGLQWFPRLCYPDKFEESIEEVTMDYYKTFYGYEMTEEECAELVAKAVPQDNAA